jgi:hypothetical protein
VFEEGTDSEAVEDRSEAVIKVGDHREGTELAGGFEELDGVRVEGPGGGGREMGVKRVEERVEGRRPWRGSELGGLASEVSEDRSHEFAPPGMFGGVAEGMEGVIGRWSCGEDLEEGSLHFVGVDANAGRGLEVTGVDLAHGLGGMDQGAGGVEEEGHGEGK